MKLHLPKFLFTAVIAAVCCTHIASAATEKKEYTIGDEGGSQTTYNVTAFVDGSTNMNPAGTELIDGTTMLGFELTADSENYFASGGFSYSGDIFIKGSETTEGPITGMVINQGWGGNVYTFAGGVYGDGDIYKTGAPDGGVTLKFTGDMSNYTGAILIEGASGNNKLIFDGATTGTGTISSNGAISMTDTVINTSSISTTNTLSIAGTTSITSALTLGVSTLELGSTINTDSDTAALSINSGTAIKIALEDILAGKFTGTVTTADNNVTGHAEGNGYLRTEDLLLFSDADKVTFNGDCNYTVAGASFTGVQLKKITATFSKVYLIENDATYTSTVMGRASLLSIGNGATLTLQESLPTGVSEGIYIRNANAAINLSGKATVLNQSVIDSSADRNVIIKGDGTYKVTTQTIATGVSLDTTTWTGTVEYSGTGTGNALTTNLQELGNENSTIALKGASGHIDTTPGGLDGYTLELVDNGDTKALTIVNGSSRTSEEVALTDAISYLGADVKGSGSIVHNAPGMSRAHTAFTFEGDVSEWTGSFSLSTKTLALRFGGDASLVKASIGKTGGTLNLKVGNTGKKTTFTNTVTVDSISVDAGNTMSLGGITTTASLTLGEGAIIDFAGGTLVGTGSLTLAAADVTVSKLSNYFNAETLSATLVTTSGEGSTLTVNEAASWTGGAYSIDGQRYTTSLSVENNSLKLNFTLANLDTLDVYVKKDGSVYAGGTLTLVMVDANGNLINTAADNYNVIGLYGGAEWDAIRDLITDGENPVCITLQGAEDFTIVGSGDTNEDPEVGAGNVSFYGKYYGEAGGTVGTAGSYNPNYIPEPASATLGLAALMMLATRRRRKA